VVVDDGSSDGTGALAAEAGALVVRHNKNYGAGWAIRSCFVAAREFMADILVTMDGDGQHKVKDLRLIMAPIIEGWADMVVGTRFFQGEDKLPGYRKLGISIITTLHNIREGYKLTDSQCGFRAYSKKAIEAIEITERGFGFSIEVLRKAKQLGLRVVEVPVSCSYDEKNCHSRHPIIHGGILLLAIIKSYSRHIVR
jgi:glycosyltransferase involved in cell wall biosynthesis